MVESIMFSLLETKLHRPSCPTKQVSRPQIIHCLNEGLASKRGITLISAPAGFGKTNCASEWVNTIDLPVTWLSLDPTDDDPGRFFTYFIAALQEINEAVGQEIASVLRAGHLPPEEILLTTLVNDIQRLETRFLLVLDDFHVIQDQIILRIMDRLLDNFPQPLHLVLISREEPPLSLARLRANDQLTEIRAGDLRFNESEAGSFLNEVMGLALSQKDIAALEARTEGWIVGLHLAGLSIRGRADPSVFISSLSGSHRFILTYLTEEVLNRQTEDIQEFLLQTSILERLCGDLCNAVTGRKDSHALLERLYNDNLFLVALDEEGRWYRYHQLFSDLLRERQKNESVVLHQRASHWYAAEGMISEAIQHALAAADYATAIHLIDSHAMDMLMQWHVKTVDGWMRAIPPEWIAHSPRANLAFAWLHLSRRNSEQAMPYLKRSGELFADPHSIENDPSLEAKWLAIQAMLLTAQGNADESLRLCTRALEIAPLEDEQTRSMIYTGLANIYQLKNDYDHAVGAFQTVIQLGQATGNTVSELLGISGLALLAIQHGQYHFAFEFASRGIDRIERSGSLPAVSMAVYGELAVILYQWHQLEQAHDNFQRSIQISTLSGYSDAELFYAVILSRLFQIRGDLDAAAQEIQKAVVLMQVEAPAVVREEVIAQQIRIYLIQGRLAEAEGLLKSQEGSRGEGYSFFRLEPGQGLSTPIDVLNIAALRILLDRARVTGSTEELKQGLEIANHLIAGALQYNYTTFAMEAILVRAQMHATLGDDQASLADIIQALELGQPEGFISIFVEEGSWMAVVLKHLLDQKPPRTIRLDYIKQILGAFPTHRPHEAELGSQHPMSEPLTEREVDVLRLIADGMKYEEIARKLFISLNTVRSHVKAIYGKLGVDNRTKAIEMARVMRIL
ncbi:MAG: tetratricopeptide repeat protein [Anaerolineaceae bacterium]|nr:tetratricopeptide repeat protein [Anaerolineaceae bacterium]